MSEALQLITVPTPRVPVRVHQGGQGPDLLYLHGAGGLGDAEQPFLTQLARRFRVHAPLLPGYGDSEECPELRDMLDITLHGWDVVEALGLSAPILVGHSMGGMIAAEMAAVAPNDVARLGLIAPAGLWLDDHPLPDIFATLPYEMPALMFHDPEAGARLMTAGLDFSDPKFLQHYLVQNARQLGMAGRILFPIPDRGLATRLYRIKARTLLIWGESDRLIPPLYAQEFARAIKGAEVAMILEAGHAITIEKPEGVVEALSGLGG